MAPVQLPLRLNHPTLIICLASFLLFFFHITSHHPTQSQSTMGFLFSKEESTPAEMVQIVPENIAEKPQNRVLVIGGAYAGLSAVIHLLELANGGEHRPTSVPLPPVTGKPLRSSVQITMIDERDGFYHTIGSPLALADDEYAEKAWRKYADVKAIQHPSIRVVQGSVTNLNCSSKTATITYSTGHTSIVEYDYAICCSGLRREHPSVPQSIFREKYLEECKSHISDIRSVSESIVIVGGGAVGVEMSAELKLCFPDKSVKLIHSHDHVLSGEPLPDKFKDVALGLLHEQGVETILGERVVSSNPDSPTDTGFTVRLKSGKTLRAGKVIWAISRPVPTSTYAPAAALDHEGFIAVTPQLRFPSTVPNAEYHFAAGDIMAWSGIKRCGAAMYFAQIAIANMHQLMLQAEGDTDTKLVDAPSVEPMIALAVGKKAATFYADNVAAGEEQLKASFGEDLGLTVVWKYLKLGEAFEMPKEKEVEGKESSTEAT
ncbi:hypothetical protein VE01_10205 [Pseudogymnoascus verrucosus]|uniref:FAD/NAD(P)-binding domain-containing protein n=1 Tax=Pseudogymnoascus verrucosus TaxID=342668 RepID=A0A1B8G7C7_9PEZI|nr:uncharacterized protein VE01_10205 [Pseudogymnoascus verrucosus]OBT91746.2 hypothetical protein VE01_10205 [Pseudogymnoascus verrucosus]